MRVGRCRHVAESSDLGTRASSVGKRRAGTDAANSSYVHKIIGHAVIGVTSSARIKLTCR